MLGSIPHRKFCFYHLPTRGRAGIKLGDAWYVSNVSIIFYCSMLLYYQSWMFYMHLYAILYDFWDQPINLEPSASFCFFLVSEYRRKGKPNGVQLTWNSTEIVFGPEEAHGVPEMDQRSPEATMRVGAPYPPGRAPYLVAASGTPWLVPNSNTSYITPNFQKETDIRSSSAASLCSHRKPI